MKITQTLYGTTADGIEVPSFTITNSSGAYIELVAYGATLNKIVVPDRDGKLSDVLVGFDTMAGQELCTDSQGRTVGRVANRIAGKGITIDSQNYPITKNVDGKFTLHGKDGNEGFPGNVHNEVTFSFDEENAVKIQYVCTPDRATAINVTNHAYFNLEGFDGGQILDHEVQLLCDAYTPTDENAIPTGEIRSVEGTPFDFRTPKTIGKDVAAEDEQLKIGRGFDHNFRIENYDGTKQLFAVVREAKSGRVMRGYTDLPGVQFYIGNFMDGTQIGKAGKPLNYRCGFCLETQYFPDALNHAEFIPCLFTPRKPFISQTVYQFSAE